MRPSVLLVVPALLLSGIAGPAAAAPTRTLAVDYVATALVSVDSGDGRQLFGLQCGATCVEFTTARRGERTITITVTDASGLAVGWVASSGRTVRFAGCGRGVVRSQPNVKWYVTPAVVTSCQAAPTRGRLEVRLSS